MKCPRCQRASPDGAVFCPGCGAPLALRSEPSPRTLDGSLSLDRRAGVREPALDPAEAERSASWDLGAPFAAAAALARGDAPLEPARLHGPALGPDELGDGPDDFIFSPVPELDALEGGPVLSPAPSPLGARVMEHGTPSPAPFHRALGLAPDPVLPDDLDGAGVAVDEVAPGGQLDRDLDLGAAPGAAITPRPFAAATRALSLEAPRADPLDLALDLGRAAVAGPVRDAVAPGGSALDLSLPAVARPDERRLPLPRPAARPRAPRAGRRAAAWAIDAAPFVALGIGAVMAVYGRVPVSPGASAGTLELVTRDGGAIARPLLACVAILALVYQTLAHALAGATLGKWLLGLRLVGPDGARPSVARSAGRAALSAASVLLLGLGLLPALFTRSGRALHDISSGTQVVEAP